MAEPTVVRIRELRLRVPRHALATTSDAALADAIGRQLADHLDPTVSGPMADEVVRQVRAASGRLGKRP